MLETWTEFLVPGWGLALPHLLMAFGGVPADWKFSLHLSRVCVCWGWRKLFLCLSLKIIIKLHLYSSLHSAFEVNGDFTLALNFSKVSYASGESSLGKHDDIHSWNFFCQLLYFTPLLTKPKKIQIIVVVQLKCLGIQSKFYCIIGQLKKFIALYSLDWKSNSENFSFLKQVAVQSCINEK